MLGTVFVSATAIILALAGCVLLAPPADRPGGRVLD
jgi:hypothetical protein